VETFKAWSKARARADGTKAYSFGSLNLIRYGWCGGKQCAAFNKTTVFK